VPQDHQAPPAASGRDQARELSTAPCDKSAPPHPLTPELGRAKRRAELEAAFAKTTDQMAANDQLATTRPAKVANADAKALAFYLQAIGWEVDADRINRLLVILAVLLVECGAGLSLTVGLALSGAAVGRTEASAAAPADHPGQSVQPPVQALPSTPATAPVLPTARPATVLDWVAGQGGRALTSRRKLADALGRPATTVADEHARLAAAGAIKVQTSPRGTLVELAGAGRPN
jgi:hypothetical protein